MTFTVRKRNQLRMDKQSDGRCLLLKGGEKKVRMATTVNAADGTRHTQSSEGQGRTNQTLQTAADMRGYKSQRHGWRSACRWKLNEH